MSSGKVRPVNPTPDDWKRVWAAIDARRDELGWSYTELYDATVSDTTLRAMQQRGKGVTRPGVKRKITDGLGWSANSIDSILAGGAPVVAQPPRSQIDTLTQIVNRTAGRLKEVAEQLDALERRVDRLERQGDG